MYKITFEEYDQTLLETFTTKLFLKVPHDEGTKQVLHKYAACYEQYHELFQMSLEHLKSRRGAVLDESFPLFVHKTKNVQGQGLVMNQVKNVACCLD